MKMRPTQLTCPIVTRCVCIVERSAVAQVLLSMYNHRYIFLNSLPPRFSSPDPNTFRYFHDDWASWVFL